MTKAEWELLCSDDCELRQESSVFVVAMFRCGWFHHTEGQLASIIAILRCLGVITNSQESMQALVELKLQIAKRKRSDNTKNTKN